MCRLPTRPLGRRGPSSIVIKHFMYDHHLEQKVWIDRVRLPILLSWSAEQRTRRRKNHPIHVRALKFGLARQVWPSRPASSCSFSTLTTNNTSSCFHHILGTVHKDDYPDLHTHTQSTDCIFYRRDESEGVFPVFFQPVGTTYCMYVCLYVCMYVCMYLLNCT